MCLRYTEQTIHILKYAHGKRCDANIYQMLIIDELVSFDCKLVHCELLTVIVVIVRYLVVNVVRNKGITEFYCI